MNVKEKLSAIRKKMKEEKIDIYYIPNEDDHLSEEYVANYFKCKKYMSGFTGDYGCLIITQKEANLWTDGRYFTQAEDELKGSTITLMRMRQEGVPTPMEFIAKKISKNGTLGYDGKVVSATSTMDFSKILKEKNAKVKFTKDIVGEVWKDRPAMPSDSIFTLSDTYTGESTAKKLERVRKEMKDKKADALIVTVLEDVAYLFNIRGNDIASTPVVYAYALVTANKVSLYLDRNKVTTKVAKELSKNKVRVCEYDELGSDLKELKGKVIWTDLNRLNTYLFNFLDASNKVLPLASPIAYYRAIKNKVEINNTRNAHLKDGVAMTKFAYWLKNNVGKIPMDEVSVANVLYDLRSAQKDYIEPSFTTIAGYKANAAMMHYSATPEQFAVVKNEGFLLVDSGGTYKDGTTDITRTFALGKITNLEKKYYTTVLKGHIDLAMAKFLKGTTGMNLDILARGPVWNLDIDYQCGTGHGVGHVLSVHEGPQTIRWGNAANGHAAILEEGMIVTDEPGIYLPRKLGIRIEDELLVQTGAKNEYGQFMFFENLTLCPIDLDAVDPKYLNQDEIDYLNAYHANVYKKISPYLDPKEKTWLKIQTRKITK